MVVQRRIAPIRAVWTLAAVLVVLALSGAACGLYRAAPLAPTPTPSHASIVRDGGFEARAGAWMPSGAGAFVAKGIAHGGTQSAALRTPAGGSGSVAIVQALDTAAFPEFVSGFYRLDAWHPASGARSIEFAVTVRGGDFADGAPSHTVRFVIGGLAAAPPGLPPTEKYVFLSRAAPKVGVWTYFGYPVKDAFEKAFGRAPTRWTGIDLSLAATTGGATAYFDDIYAGPQFENPNRPPAR